mmetsp:Transcript_267/g.672  ORF Transcript_267/g.672 Transcript_267/m.672 type:complete len:124 (+) Transcript_267:87-458(+)
MASAAAPTGMVSKETLLGVVARGTDVVEPWQVHRAKKARTTSSTSRWDDGSHVTGDGFSPPVGWAPHAWRALPVKQQPDYKCRKSVAIARAKLSSLPPLVTAVSWNLCPNYLPGCLGHSIIHP